MALFEGKTPSERNKLIAAGALGLIALIALYLAFGRSFFGGSTATATVKTSPTPKPAAPSAPTGDRALPTVDEQKFQYETTPVDYRPGNAYAPDPGRNIFAFYEPPPPCPTCPTPTPKPTAPPPPPTPAPTPPILLRSPIPQNVYAGSRGFTMQVDGEYFTADSRIYFNQVEMPTKYMSPQRLSTEIPANMIAQEGAKQIIIQTPDGKMYSNAGMLMVNPPPKPTVQYIGMIGRKRYNNDTAYFIAGSPTPFGARLNDVVGGQFRLIDISPTEVIFEDVNLGFKHRVAITKAPTGTASGGGATGFPSGFPNGFPAQGEIPGIPSNIPRYVPPQQVKPPEKKSDNKKEDVDDNDPPQ